LGLIAGTVVLALSGLLCGSFLNVCILRIPAGESVVTVPSHCPGCDRRLRPPELIPVLSWISLRSRCRGCGARISAQYPLVEAANAALWVLAAVFRGFTAFLPLECAVLSALLGLSVIDARTREIPPVFNVFIGVCGILRIAVALISPETGVRGVGDAAPYIVGAVAVSVPLGIVYLASGGRAIGGGDLKLLAACGLFLGWRLVVLGFFAGCVLGAAIHLARMRISGAERALALGPYLSAGMALAMLLGERAISWYLGLIGR
jgi:leader peptidase (prepilin peptidase)/N-methyltransferase